MVMTPTAYAHSMPRHRIVVFTGNFAYSVRKGVDEIDRALPGIEWLILIHSPRRRPVQLLRNQWSNLKRNGWRWIPYQIIDIWQRLRQRVAPVPEHDWNGRRVSAAALSQRGNIRMLVVSDIHAEETLQSVRAFAPSLGLSLAAPILHRPLFSIPKLGTLNLHKGKVPDYRGMPPAFWELWNDETCIGCTIHWVDDKLDTGNVVRATTIECPAYPTVRGMQLYLDEVGVELMRDAVHAVLEGDEQSVAQASGGTTYRKPTLAQVSILDAKLVIKQAPPLAYMRTVLKTALLTAVIGCWRFGLSRLFKPRLTVLLYHRVSDDARDNLTVGVQQFDRQMALLRRHCRVLSLEQVLSLTEIPRSDDPIVCVTFDDGYLDNYDAAQILLRHEIPAAFFVSTGLIGTSRVFPHDIRRGNQGIPMMNWFHLRKMRDAGFTIGSHTVNHIDCAAESEDLVRDELIASRDKLRQELDIKDVLFAYPYGGRRHMTPQRLEIVRQLDYAACLSAYGGANIGSVDRYNVVRRGIHWEFSDQSFLFECLGVK